MKKFVYAALAFAPTLAFAQGTVPDFSGVGSLVTNIQTNVLAKIVPFIFALAIIYFLWGLVGYIRSAGNEKEREAAKGHIIWGILGLVVMVGLYGLIGWVQGIFKLDSSGTIQTPTLPK